MTLQLAVNLKIYFIGIYSYYKCLYMSTPALIISIIILSLHAGGPVNIGGATGPPSYSTDKAFLKSHAMDVAAIVYCKCYVHVISVAS